MRPLAILYIITCSIPLGILYNSGNSHSVEQNQEQVSALESQCSIKLSPCSTNWTPTHRAPAMAERPRVVNFGTSSQNEQAGAESGISKKIPLDMISWDMQEEDWHFSEVSDEEYDIEARIVSEYLLDQEITQQGQESWVNMFQSVSWSPLDSYRAKNSATLSESRQPVKAPKPETTLVALQREQLLSLIPDELTPGHYRVVDNHGFVGALTVLPEDTDVAQSHAAQSHYVIKGQQRTIHFIRLESTHFVPAPAMEESVPSRGANFWEALLETWKQVR